MRLKILFLAIVCSVIYIVLAQRTTVLGVGALTAVLDSGTFDTGIATGGQLNSLTWHGTLPIGTSIRFQLATSSSAGGPWNFVGYDGTSGTYYALDQPSGVPYVFTLPSYSAFSGIRYFRYRVTLISDAAQIFTPRVDDIDINWSP